MILVIGGIKGGTGKTTLATNLAVILKSEGHSVFLVDADEQQSAMDWSHQRAQWRQKNSHLVEIPTVAMQSKNLYSHLQSLRKDYDYVIVDTGGRDTVAQRSALSVADYYLIPFRPRSMDIWTVDRVKSLVNEARTINDELSVFFCINQADSRGSDNAATLSILGRVTEANLLFSLVGNRKAFPNASAQGLSVLELPGELQSKEEIHNLYRAIYRKHIGTIC